MIDVSIEGDSSVFEGEGRRKMLIVEVDDPAGTVAKLRGALGTSDSLGRR